MSSESLLEEFRYTTMARTRDQRTTSEGLLVCCVPLTMSLSAQSTMAAVAEATCAESTAHIMGSFAAAEAASSLASQEGHCEQALEPRSSITYLQNAHTDARRRRRRRRSSSSRRRRRRFNVVECLFSLPPCLVQEVPGRGPHGVQPAVLHRRRLVEDAPQRLNRALGPARY